MLSLVLAIGGAAWVMLFHKDNALNAEGIAYAQDAIRKITTDWNPDELWVRGNPILSVKYSKQHFRDLFDADRKIFGKIQAVKSTQGKAIETVTPGRPMITAWYTFRVDYERGIADVITLVEKDGDVWHIDLFEIKPFIQLVPFSQANKLTEKNKLAQSTDGSSQSATGK
jgi:hypothetical protein